MPEALHQVVVAVDNNNKHCGVSDDCVEHKEDYDRQPTAGGTRFKTDEAASRFDGWNTYDEPTHIGCYDHRRPASPA